MSSLLAIGLPLLQTLTIEEFRALLAHEFAHFYSGDTRLGPWVFRGRETMVRVFNNLGKKSQIMGMLTRWAIVGAGVIGGLAAGAIIGGAIANSPPPPPAYYPPPPPPPAYAPAYAQLGPGCYWGRRRVWVEGYGYQVRTVPICP